MDRLSIREEGSDIGNLNSFYEEGQVWSGDGVKWDFFSSSHVWTRLREIKSEIIRLIIGEG